MDAHRSLPPAPMSYSSLFSSGVAQLWDAPRSHRAHSHYRSFLSFDIAESLHTLDTLSAQWTDDDSEDLPKYHEHEQFDQYDPFDGPEYPIHLIPSSASHMSCESDPQPTRRSSSFDGIYLPLQRHRSLPDAKPAPSTSPPSIPPSTRSSARPRRYRPTYSTPPPFFSFSSARDDDNSSSSSSSSCPSPSEDSIHLKTPLSSTSTVALYPQQPQDPEQFSAALELELIPPPPKPPKARKGRASRSPSRASRTSRTTSTVSTRYRRQKRSDALACLEGRERPVDAFPFVPVPLSNVTFRRRRPSGGPRRLVGTPSKRNPVPSTFVSFTSDDEEVAAPPVPRPPKTPVLRCANNLSPSPSFPVSPASSKTSRKKPSRAGLFGRVPRERDDNFIDLQ
ncbi:hypothetical protein BS47DRAFT_1179562 [Hydnum rufescens UP504]|uniref:Uncharacterized protein n=1 Tax=Hydnum rufescens UP504 TaxID=1448309 RepID=A0A9P6DU72_9AGAM|nr:hypothetical protein BS47DRAFT_1179562 [Hydnum rufescens UP504]